MSPTYRLEYILLQKSLIDSSSESGAKPDRMEGNIEFRDVQFRYPSRPDAPVSHTLYTSVCMYIIQDANTDSYIMIV